MLDRDKGLQQADEWRRQAVAMIEERDRQLREIKILLEEKNRQLDEIYASKGWQWLTRFRKWKETVKYEN